ncbi:MAG: hypothetical protein NXI31_27020 [bacterium]|nr:hypothetical protein [bacterium]
MSFRTRHLVGFSVVVCAALAATVMLPSTHEGVAVDSATGEATPRSWRRLAELRDTGDLALLRAGLAGLPPEERASEFVRGLSAMIERELGAPSFDRSCESTAPVEAYFAGASSATTRALDARAARVQRELAGGTRVPAASLAALARAFGGVGRAGAELRWLQRAFTADPAARGVADRLVAVQIAHGRLHDAAATVAAHTEDRSSDVAWQRRCAELGAWLADPAAEIAALERLVELAPEAADRSRLIELYAHVGTPERALRHAVAMADDAAETAAAAKAAGTALRAGFVEEGLGMLRRAAQRAPAAGSWWSRFAALARQDLRIDDATDALEVAAAHSPVAVDSELEDLYRRTDQPAQLVELLERRLSRTPEDVRLWQEVITLRAALGQRDAARLLTLQRDAALADPKAWIEALPPAQRAQAGAVRQAAIALSLAPEPGGAIVGATLERLRPFFAQREFRELAELLLARHPDDPRAIPMRRELVDLGRTPAQAERAAAALAASYPDDVELAEFWLERAQWAESVPGQIAARRRLAALVPGDNDNRFELASLLEFLGDREAALVAWERLVHELGVRSRALPRYVDALFSSGREAEAVEWLRQLAEHPEATVAERLRAADELFYRRSYDRAQRLYGTVLRDEPAEPRALLRLGQIAIWTNDARRGRQLLERRLAVSPDDAALVRFYLGETLWTLGEAARARAVHERALQEFERAAADDLVSQTCVATMLARLGRHADAAKVYRRLVARSPRDIDLVLDYADLALQLGDLALVHALARQARSLAPEHPRRLRLLAAAAARAGDHIGAEQYYEEVLARTGADATVLGELAQLRTALGEWRSAHRAATQWLQQQPGSGAAMRLESELRERLATTVVTEFRDRRLGEDRTTELALAGRLPLTEREWLQARVATVWQRGSTSLTPAGRASVDYTRLDLGFGQRSGANDRWLVGVTTAPGVAGELPIGAFGALRCEWTEPFRSLEIRGRVNEVWDRPAAAAALGGRRSGLDVLAHVDFGQHYWLACQAGLDRLSLDSDGMARVDDSRWRGQAALGWRLVDGDPAVTAAFDPLAPIAGPDSPFLLADEEVVRPWLVNAWLGWQAAHLIGDGALANVLPLVRDDEFVIAAARVDRFVARGHGLAVTGFTGIETRGGEAVFGLEGAWTWRPAFGAEVVVSGRYGSALGRRENDENRELRCEVVWRW